MLPRLAAWSALLFLAVITVGPIDVRPISFLPPPVERFGAFLVVGLLFGLAYSRRPWSVALGIALVALGLEVAQALAPGRHAASTDALVKIAGGLAGLVVARLGSGRPAGPASAQRPGYRLVWKPSRNPSQIQ